MFKFAPALLALTLLSSCASLGQVVGTTVGAYQNARAAEVVYAPPVVYAHRPVFVRRPVVMWHRGWR